MQSFDTVKGIYREMDMVRLRLVTSEGILAGSVTSAPVQLNSIEVEDFSGESVFTDLSWED